MGWRAAYQAWKPLEAYAVERILADHQHAVIDLGGGHSVQEDQILFARVRFSLAPVRNPGGQRQATGRVALPLAKVSQRGHRRSA